ncbi:MAG: hypothetical protein HWN81_09955 [Candidatus Lokiarchaeota archaeon]|nr:hypothetical protein [Candidatus Lokiarchaeota archaeon]
MKKYYVVDWQIEKKMGDDAKFLTIADDPLTACALAIHLKFNTAMINGSYRVSEKGFEMHEDDIFVDSNQVNQVYLDLYENNYFKDQGDN